MWKATALSCCVLALCVPAHALALRAVHPPAAHMVCAYTQLRCELHANAATGGGTDETSAPWFEESAASNVPAAAAASSMPLELSADDAAAPAAKETLASPEEEKADDTTILTEEDLVNTRWKLLVTPRDGSWMLGGEQMHEFTLIADGSVVWGQAAGGFGTGGRWTLKDQTIEVIRSTPLGVVTGRDYYMSTARAEVTKQLQFAVRGVIRSYNALYPVAVVADFVAVRVPGRFVRDED